jgi:hypothetical protein
MAIEEGACAVCVCIPSVTCAWSWGICGITPVMSVVVNLIFCVMCWIPILQEMSSYVNSDDVFSHGRLSNMTTIYKCVEELRATGSIIDRNRTRRRRVLMKADKTGVKSETALRIVARFAQQTGVCAISTKCNKTDAFASIYNNRGSRTAGHRSWRKSELCEQVPSCGAYG